MVAPHLLTPRQFRQARIRACITQHACRRREAEELNLPGDAEVAHFRAVYDAAEEGRRTRDVVLDRMAPGLRRKILHDFPDLHRSYMLRGPRSA